MEVCVDNIQSALNAAAGGAARIELCSALSEGGLTPSVGFYKIVKERISIPIFVMLRPRRGMDFVYSEEEILSIKYDVLEFVRAGATGFVFGILREDGSVNCEACSEILSVVPKDCSVTFHRAFDGVVDPFESLNQIISLGFDRILTSGQEKNAMKGTGMLRRLIEAANGQIIIVPGAGVNEKNAADILNSTGAKELHGSAKRSVSIPFRGRMDATIGSNDTSNEIFITDTDIVRQIVSIIKQFTAR